MGLVIKEKLEAKREGLKEGMQKGLHEGLQKGLHEGIQKGIQKGLQKGIQEGRQKGLREGKVETAKNMLSMGQDIDFVAKATGLPKKEVEELARGSAA